MFGFVVPDKSELKMKEYEMYKAVYCSLCKTMGKQYGLIARLSLSYDFTFMALLEIGLVDGCDNVLNKHCVYNPLKKCKFLENKNALNKTSAFFAISLYYKMLDNVHDEKGIKKLVFLILVKLFKRHYIKAKNNYPKFDEIASNYIEKQNQLESNKCNNIDEISEPTANMLGLAFKELSPENSEPIYKLGYCIGKWIYLTDAAADIEKDIKHGGYNVLSNSCKTKLSAIEKINPILNFCMHEAANAFNEIKFYKYKDIVGNIIYLGLSYAVKTVFKEKTKCKTLMKF